MKKAQLYDKAEAMYVEDLYTFDKVAAELSCSERTIRTWAVDGRWSEKRVNVQNSRVSLTDDVRDIAVLLAHRIKIQLEDEIEPSPHILNAFTRMASSLVRVREYDKMEEVDASAKLPDDDLRRSAKAAFADLFKEDINL